MREETQSIVPAPPDFCDALVFFDLRGTLLERDSLLSAQSKETLSALCAEAGRVVLVTGQSSDDPQVADVCGFFVKDTPAPFSAYVTRGGLRLAKRGAALETDLDYLRENRLDEGLQDSLGRLISEALAQCGLTPIIPVACIDQVAMRVNLPPPDRPRFVEAISAAMARRGVAGFQSAVEGRTSVFVMRSGIGKRRAVEFELRAVGERAGKAYFFGDEFHQGGNDREVAEIPSLKLMPLGAYESFGEAADVRAIGHTPADLYRFLLHHLRSDARTRRRLPVVFVSLGGTKIQIAALDDRLACASDAEVHWRDADGFSELVQDTDPSRFCGALAGLTGRFLRRRGCAWADVGRIGIGFPGPGNDGIWHSNNLTAAFREGVDLATAFRHALARVGGVGDRLPVHVAFDAQCDAGGELFHPRGRLVDVRGDSRATVLNVATGIAAGLVRDGRVLVGDTDFVVHLGSGYDGGAGQIGRHLWYDVAGRMWTYRFLDRGRTPVVPGCVRMTEYLSGPALAARLLTLLGEADALPLDATEWGAPTGEILAVHDQLAAESDLTARTQLARRRGNWLSSSVLSWADAVHRSGSPPRAADCVREFAETVAREWGSAIAVLARAPGWAPFLRRIVLTGGVGIRFLASSDSQPEKSYLRMLKKEFPAATKVERSLLVDSAEREIYLFFHQPM